MLEWAQDAPIYIQYAVLFLLAAAPWMDVSIVVPLGILWGLSPIGVSLTAFTGNLLLILLLGAFFKQVESLRQARKLKKGITEPSRKERRSKEIWQKYGIPGLALLAPIIVGTDIAAIIALAFGASKMGVIRWMTISLALWTIIFAAGAVYGFSFLNLL
ncbi:small multi-drug export protein [Cytobacillus firmus]|nr:small multi-drug export protein [Cytobacillus firmus]